ncbi:HNH endonuclease [Hyunsoonleella jejuensis]|uniref:HNH endonuclease n=1 Tax=Hyunsoonleella jejuensis TaxID=419940 RepID=A0A1H9HA06_9FLAO|nr:HNH endonuclease [Hyunsoonleella jejuensis]SEQ59165.1 HNH endonuclease [Hyunsoonleella jejuensis]
MQKLPFIPNQLYNRRKDIHAIYGGNWQSGICPSANYPYIFIFSGKSGKQHGYEDGWDNPNVFTYTGEGQSGDMQFTRGNLALRDHIDNGKRVFLFESDTKGIVRFISEVECFDVDYFETPDTLGAKRIGIKFFFNRVGINLKYQHSKIKELSLDEPSFRDYALKPPNETERKGLVTSRVGQGAYRKRIIHRWEYKCAVTGFDKLKVLIASHIVPWADSTDNERLDVNNGLLLSPAYDALFDKHLISFEGNGKIILSDSIEFKAYEKIGVTGNEKINGLNQYNLPYLDKHRNHFYERT